MQKNGTITQLVPDGGYQSQNGYINTFQMSIQCPDGLVTGQIGSKTQNYPLGVGSQISVEMTETEHGTRFKKFNAQYAGQQQNQPQQQPPPPTQQAAPQPAPASIDRDAKIVRGNALNAVMSASDVIPLDQIGKFLDAGVGFIKTGVWNVPPF